MDMVEHTDTTNGPVVPMPTLDDLIPQTHVFLPLKAHNKKTLLHIIAERAAPLMGSGVEARELFEALLHRERLGSTGIGNGVAIPHARMDGLSQVYGFFARLEKPMMFDALDDQPVDLLFILISPEDAGSDHLKALARISRFIRSGRHLNLLRSAKDQSAAFVVLSQPEAQAA